MKEYETVWEIFNECANNQMRDVFIDEICTDDPEKFVLDKFKGKCSSGWEHCVRHYDFRNSTEIYVYGDLNMLLDSRL